MMRRIVPRQRHDAHVSHRCFVRFTNTKSPNTKPLPTPDFFPYGSASFRKVRTDKLFWCDNSKYIHDVVENSADHQLFLRPPRWGKSLFMNMLRCYLDVNMEKDFDELFEGTEIHKRKQELMHRNKYHVMKFDFSVDVTDIDVMAVKKEFDQKIGNAVEDFCLDYDVSYGAFTSPLAKMERVIKNAIKTKEAKVFLLIDEYDRFANKLMFENPTAYDKIVAGTSGDKYSSPIRCFFETVKSIDEVRSFTTGLTPIALADASGANNIRFITQDPRFADMLGFTAADLERGLKMLFDAADVPKALDTARRFFNGYRFPYQLREVAGASLFTPQLCLKFLQDCCSGRFRRSVLDNTVTLADMSDPNSKVSSNVVALLAKHSELPLILASMTTPQGVCGATVQESFKLNELTTGRTMDLPVSFMVWHGLLTRGDPTGAAKDGFKIPNDVVGDPTKDDGLMSTIFKGAEAANMDALEVVRNPTEEGLWKLLTAALKPMETPFNNSVSEGAIQGLIELFLRNKCGSVEVEAEQPLASGRQRFDLRMTERMGQRTLMVEFKRLRPGRGPRDADVCDLPHLAALDCKAARKVLSKAQITTEKQRLHGGAATIQELEEAAMRQCKRYKSQLLQSNPHLIVRCATAIHVTVAKGEGASTKYTSAFLVSVEP